MKKLTIIDDHPLVRHGLRQLLESEADLMVCCEAASVAEALKVIKDCQPDLAIVDLSLPDGNGLDLIKRLLSKYPELLILVSSMHDERLFAERALRAGAAGYINKQESGEQIINAVRRVLNGKIYLSEQLNQRLLLDPAENSPNPAQSSIESLSNRELEIFELIGYGLATSEIANRLHISVKTIESHRANIKSKLRLLSSGELIRSAVQWTLETQSPTT